uniref:CSON012661 protein n=1 Tax=Culicoides sonorensis TaxID=179676 RepID=A0A336KWP8_CULSO
MSNHKNIQKLSNDNSAGYPQEIYENLPCHPAVKNDGNSKRLMLAKEGLYATPLRKSDRGRSATKERQAQHLRYNISEKEVKEDENNAEREDVNPELEDKRIRSFLKDTSQMHKRLELHNKDMQNSNFSYLARKEHFANLVQQNILNDSDTVTGEEKTVEKQDTEEIGIEKASNNVMKLFSEDGARKITSVHSSPIYRPPRNFEMVDLNREWVLKKIAMCLEQRSSKKPIPLLPDNEGLVKGISSHHATTGAHHSNLPQLGYLILGSNGAGKTSICKDIQNGVNGTRGLLNRRLIGCYFINSQEPECHSLSAFVRSIVLQILAHSSYINKDDAGNFSLTEIENTESCLPEADQPLANKAHTHVMEADSKERKFSESSLLDKELEEIIKEELRAQESEKQQIVDKKLIRQASDPPRMETEKEKDEGKNKNYGTHPPLQKSSEKEQRSVKEDSSANKKSVSQTSTPSKNVNKSKIPVPVGASPKSNSSPKQSSQVSETSQTESAKYDDAEKVKDKELGEMESEMKEISLTEENENKNEAVGEEEDPHIQEGGGEAIAELDVTLEADILEEIQENCFSKNEKEKTDDDEISKKSSDSTPAPLPKSKSCRTVIADAYYEMLLSNPDIFESLTIDNIEKNPDDCFKKAILFPLLELSPPKTALLLLIDSIDENYLNEGSLISTLKGKVSAKSRNIAELLSNHIHLFPKWLFLVATAKKQNKNITKLFTGFKKLALDDLRKSHVVKDVQQYIINRLNCDFRGINLTKDIIESLNQLYIKSNGSLLYLYKVLTGIKDNFFTFREIKMIPCTLNGLYLYMCQKSFNKKQYSKVRPILNILLTFNNFVEKHVVFNCLRTHNYAIDQDEFQSRLDLMRNVIETEGSKIKIFHNSFCEWLIDVKFSTKKFLCDVNEGHVMVAMYYTMISEELCPNKVKDYIFHLVKTGEHLTSKKSHLDLLLVLLDSKANLNDCFYSNYMNCCKICEWEMKNHVNLSQKGRQLIDKYLSGELNNDFMNFLNDFFKPSLPTDSKVLKLLIETGVSNADSQISRESSINSPLFSERSQNIDSELAELLISSEKSCLQEIGSKTESTAAHNISLPLQFEGFDMELQKGKALIHVLANEGNHVLLERALKACKDQVDLEIEDLNGQTALNIAARNGHTEIVKVLLNFIQGERSRGVEVNHPDRDGWTPLRSASWGGHTEIVKILIAHPACKIDRADREGRTALRAAAWSGNEDIVKILIQAGANVNSIDKQGRTSLIAASYMGHYDIVEILLENGADVNHTDLDGRNALCVAALCGSSGYNKVISTLLEHGAKTDQTDNEGMSPLLVSSFEGNAEICELLLENGADPDLADHMGRTPLWAACTSGHSHIVKLLLFWGCGIDCMDSEGRTVLSVAAAQGNLETVRQLLDRGLDETHRDNAGWTPLHYAAFEGYADICIQLLDSGAKIDECDNEGKTALHLGAQEGHKNVIEAILDIHRLCVDQKAHDGKTAFRLACLEGHFECVETLLRYGCDVNTRDADSRSTLYILALENKLRMVKFLLEYSNVDVNIPDSEGRSALHVAAWQGHAEMVKLLITMGNANVNAMDLEYRSPLHSCAWQGNHEVMRLLLYYGAVPDHACKQGATALGISAQEGHEECVRILLQFGANPFKSDHCGRTPIKLAAKSNRNGVLRILEEYAKTDPVIEPNRPTAPQLNVPSPDKPALPPHQSHHVPKQSTNEILSGALGPSPSSIQNNLMVPGHMNATNSTQSSNNFYENTMNSADSSVQKRKSVISSQSTGSSNEVPISFTQQLQKHSRHHNLRNSQVLPTTKGQKQAAKHQQLLANVDEYQANIAANLRATDADLFDLGCMSPLYASPPRSPSSDISSPGQALPPHGFEEMGTTTASQAFHHDQHFARDTHMRIILGNAQKEKEAKEAKEASKAKKAASSNPAMRLIRNRIDSAANLIRRTPNILNITSSNNQGSSSIGVKSSTFQWRKESQM